jgi:hypothetical protein
VSTQQTHSSGARRVRENRSRRLWAVLTPIVVAVDNTPPPGGHGRTIGYWKNWAS